MPKKTKLSPFYVFLGSHVTLFELLFTQPTPIIYLRPFRDISLYPIFHELPTRPTSPSYQYYPQYQLLATIIDIISVLTTISVYSHLYGQCQWESLLCPWSHHRNYGLSNTGIDNVRSQEHSHILLYIFVDQGFFFVVSMGR